jgi:polyhydroxyalkanoate synthesis regulator phasin
MPTEIDAWVASGRLNPAQASEVVQEMVLARFLDPYDDGHRHEQGGSQRESR